MYDKAYDKEILNFIQEYQEENGRLPKWTDVSNFMGGKSIGTVYKALRRLEKNGHICRPFTGSKSSVSGSNAPAPIITIRITPKTKNDLIEEASRLSVSLSELVRMKIKYGLKEMGVTL